MKKRIGKAGFKGVESYLRKEAKSLRLQSLNPSQKPKQLKSSAKPEQIPPELLKKWNVSPNTKTIKLPLEKSYELLNAKNDEIGQKIPPRQRDPKLALQKKHFNTRPRTNTSNPTNIQKTLPKNIRIRKNNGKKP